MNNNKVNNNSNNNDLSSLLKLINFPTGNQESELQGLLKVIQNMIPQNNSSSSNSEILILKDTITSLQNEITVLRNELENIRNTVTIGTKVVTNTNLTEGKTSEFISKTDFSSEINNLKVNLKDLLLPVVNKVNQFETFIKSTNNKQLTSISQESSPVVQIPLPGESISKQNNTKQNNTKTVKDLKDSKMGLITPQSISKKNTLIPSTTNKVVNNNVVTNVQPGTTHSNTNNSNEFNENKIKTWRVFSSLEELSGRMRILKWDIINNPLFITWIKENSPLPGFINILSFETETNLKKDNKPYVVSQIIKITNTDGVMKYYLKLNNIQMNMVPLTYKVFTNTVKDPISLNINMNTIKGNTIKSVFKDFTVKPVITKDNLKESLFKRNYLL